MTFVLLANQCPTPQSRTAFLSVAAAASSPNAPVSARFTSGDTFSVVGNLNENATRTDLTASYGGGAYFVANGLTLSAGTGLNVSVSTGTAIIDGVVTLETAGRIAVPASTSHIFIWLTQSGLLTYTTSLTPPTPPACLLGNVTTGTSGVTSVDFSGVLYGTGILQRQTADSAAPTDTPPAGLHFMTVTAGGVYYWNGSAYGTLAGSGGAGGGGFQYRGLYSSGTAYVQNDVVLYTDNALYKSILAGSGHGPTNTTYWALFLPPGAPGPAGPMGLQGPAYYNFRGAWSSVSAYNMADTVYDSTGAYVAILASTGVALTDTAHWSKILPPGPMGAQGSSVFTPRGTYSSSVAYAVNDVVQANGAAYLAVAASTGQLVTNTSYWYNLLPAAPVGATGQGFNFRATWSSGTSYNPYDVVTYGGSTYNAVATSVGVTPGTDITKWAALATGSGGASAATNTTLGTVETDITQSTPIVYTKTTMDTLLAARVATANNLSDLASAATARTNLGLGAVATGGYSATEAALVYGGAGSPGFSAAVSRGDHVHPLADPPRFFEIFIPGLLSVGGDALSVQFPSWFSSRALTRVSARLETPSTSGGVTFVLEKYTGTGSFTATTTSDTFAIASGSNEMTDATSFTSGLVVTGGNKVRVNITAAGTGAANLVVRLEF